MATYADGTTEAMVGDIVKCVVPKIPIDGHCDVDGDCAYKVVRTSQSHIHVSGKVLYANRFELIKRTGAAPSPAKAEPLVKWPEETMYKSLERGEYFVYLDDPQVPCVSLGGGQHIQLIKTPKWPAWTLLTCVVESMVPVRRIRRVGVEQFEVI